MAKDVSAIATLIFAEDIGATVVTTATAINAASLNATDAYEAVQDGCIRGLGVTIEAAPTGSYTQTFTVYVAGTATSVTTSLTSTATTAYAAFANNIATVKAGDTIKCYITESSSSGTNCENVLVYVLYQLGASNI